MQIFQLSSFPIEQAGDLTALEHKLGSWFASLTYPVRLLAISKAFDLRPARADEMPALITMTERAFGEDTRPKRLARSRRSHRSTRRPRPAARMQDGRRRRRSASR